MSDRESDQVLPQDPLISGLLCFNLLHKLLVAVVWVSAGVVVLSEGDGEGVDDIVDSMMVAV